MTEDEMLEAAKYIAKRDDEVLALQQQLIAANHKLFEAGRFAGQQQALIDELQVALEQFVEQYLDLDEAYGLARSAIAKAKAFRAEP